MPVTGALLSLRKLARGKSASLLGHVELGNPVPALVSGLSPKQTLLYVCPVIPSATGGGLAMRAGNVLEALSERYRVSLLAVPHFVPGKCEVPELFRERCEDVVIVAPHPVPQHRLEQATQAYRERSFDVVHMYRLAAFPFARPYFHPSNGRARLHLDLDDIESETYRRIAPLYRSAGDGIRAASVEAQARQSWLLETTVFRMVDRIYVCSELDREKLRNRCPAEICLLNNVVRLPAVVRPASVGGDYLFLFVGNLGYYPNEDAVRYFCRQILPLIREKASRRFRVDIAGAEMREGLLELNAADVHVVGEVADVQPWYESSHAVIVPLRAGGGTRIKILEAFSYQRPVVTTSIGMEGIDAQPNRHLLLADEPEAFAAACVRLMNDPALAQDLVQNANSLLAGSHMIETMKSVLSSL